MFLLYYDNQLMYKGHEQERIIGLKYYSLIGLHVRKRYARYSKFLKLPYIVPIFYRVVKLEVFLIC
jgi:hypothetical protein